MQVLSREAIHSQLAAGLRVVLHLDRAPSGARRLHQIGVLASRADGIVEPGPALTFESGRAETGRSFAQLEDLLR